MVCCDHNLHGVKCLYTTINLYMNRGVTAPVAGSGLVLLVEGLAIHTQAEQFCVNITYMHTTCAHQGGVQVPKWAMYVLQ
jgi:hypothetical protein